MIFVRLRRTRSYKLKRKVKSIVHLVEPYNKGVMLRLEASTRHCPRWKVDEIHVWD